MNEESEPGEPAALSPVFSATASPGNPVAPPPSPTASASTNLGLFLQSPQTSEHLVGKMTPQHVTQLIGLQGEEDKRKHRERIIQLSVAAGLTVLGFILIPILSLIFLSFNQPNLLLSVLSLFVGLLGGGGIGFSAGRATAPKSESTAK